MIPDFVYLMPGMDQYYQPSVATMRGDITQMNVEAIVNSANANIAVGGGVDWAIHAAAGEELFKEFKKKGGVKKGEAIITKGYNLPAKFVIHTVAPVYGRENGQEENILKMCYWNSLEVAKENKIRTIAFPSIGTGVFGNPVEFASKIAGKTLKDFLDFYLEREMYIFDAINFVLFSKEDNTIYTKNFRSIFKK
ncbi:MAG: macro domain-containing protein [Patescibacteria group bacterium]